MPRDVRDNRRDERCGEIELGLSDSGGLSARQPASDWRSAVSLEETGIGAVGPSERREQFGPVQGPWGRAGRSGAL